MHFPRRHTDHLVKYHQHGRQDEDDYEHTHDRSPCHQGTQRRDHIDIRIQSHPEGCGEKSQRRYNDGID